MKLKKHIYRPGDEVWIIKPEMFLRCGYPLTYKMLTVDYEYHPRLNEALAILGLDPAVSGINTVSGMNIRDRERLGEALAQIAVRQKEFGGPERRIYTAMISGYQDAIVKVLGKLTVRTGDYYKPGTRMQEYRISSNKLNKSRVTRINVRGGLDNAKTHIILKTSGGWIEARNVIPAFYRKLCGSDEGAKVFREALPPIKKLKGVYVPKVAKKQFEWEEI